MTRRQLETASDYMRAYPNICSAIIAHSLGYATPSCAAQILRDAKEGRENWCEWLDACYGHDARRCVSDAVRAPYRWSQTGYMADRKTARALVDRAIADGTEPIFASWF